MTFDYPAKGGIRRTVAITGPTLATALRALRRARAESGRLLVYRERDGLHELRADDVNARFKEFAGGDCSVKDLRTWHATVLAAVAFAAQGRAESRRARTRAEAAAMRTVAEELGNTPAVARKSYVDPRVIAAYERGHTIRAAMRRTSRFASVDATREVVERAFIRLLHRQAV